MELKQLEYFCAVAEAKSISAAARNLHMTQPPLGRQIALLEDELGVCLFQRNNKGVELTQAGLCLYQQSLQMLQNLKIMTENVWGVDAGMRGRLKIGVIYSVTPIVLEHLTEYQKKFPKVELYVRLGTPDDLLDDLYKGNLHVLFLRGPMQKLPDFSKKILGEDPLELVMSPQLDPAPDLKTIPIELLDGVPMCLLRSDDLMGYNSHLVNTCLQKGFSPNIVCQCYDSPMVMQMVQTGFGISYQPKSILKTLGHTDIYSKPIEEAQVKSYPMLIWNEHIHQANCIKVFVSMFQEIEVSTAE